MDLYIKNPIAFIPLGIESLLQMDLLGHDFFIYVDVEDQTTNVLYRREDGEVGLLEVKES